MYSWLQRVVLALGVAGVSGSMMRAAGEPCSGKYFGAHLAGNLYDLSLTAGELKLLNGREDPKLKRHLEYRLVSAAAEARRHIEEGATWDEAAIGKASEAPDLINGIDRATGYVAEHDLDVKHPAPLDKFRSKPSADLEVIKKWLSKQR
jgi:hypothetical protein